MFLYGNYGGPAAQIMQRKTYKSSQLKKQDN